MRWLLLLAFALCACGGSESTEGGACAEPPTIFRGESYEYAATADVQPAGRIGTLVRPGCNDSNGPHEDDRRVAVEAIRSVDPRVAILVEGGVYANAESSRVTRSDGACVIAGTRIEVTDRPCGD